MTHEQRLKLPQKRYILFPKYSKKSGRIASKMDISLELLDSYKK